MNETIMDRFEAKFDRGPDCWNWTANKDKDGYGRFQLDGRRQAAHRVAYDLYVGPIPDGQCCLHRCDNPSCVNPTHLFLGTDADNSHDRENKGRGNQASGEKHGRAKLTDKQVVEVRTKYAATGEYQRVIALDYGVSPRNISLIVTRRTWAKL